MSRRNRYTRRRSLTNRRTVNVSINVPEGVRLPNIIYAPPALQRQRQRRHITVNLAARRNRPMRKKNITVVLPRHSAQHVSPSKVYYDHRANRLRIMSKRNTERYLKYETGRTRNEERKSRKRRYSDPYLSALTGDKYGIVGANVQSSPRALSDAALVSYSLGG
jgi:hypothetical protein